MRPHNTYALYFFWVISSGIPTFNTVRQIHFNDSQLSEKIVFITLLCMRKINDLMNRININKSNNKRQKFVVHRKTSVNFNQVM